MTADKPGAIRDFVELMTQHQGRLYGYVLSLSGDPDAANDVLQEANIVLWKQSSQFELGSSFKAWAFRIAHFQFMAYRQKQLRDKVLFSGDNILGYGTAVIHPPDGNMTDYLKSLERLLGFDISLILPGHGPLIGKAEAKIREYIKHRLEREQQVIAALRQGRTTIGDVTQMIYADASAALQRVAEFSVQAHLEKLMREGRVKKEGARYLLVSEN